MDTVSVQAEKMAVAPTNQIHGLLEIEVGTAWLGAAGTSPAITRLGSASMNRHLDVLGHFAFFLAGGFCSFLLPLTEGLCPVPLPFLRGSLE